MVIRGDSILLALAAIVSAGCSHDLGAQGPTSDADGGGEKDAAAGFDVRTDVRGEVDGSVSDTRPSDTGVPIDGPSMPPDARVDAPSGPQVSGNPVAYWNLDEGKGTSCADGSGNGHSGTLGVGPVWERSVFPGIKFSNPSALTFAGMGGVVTIERSASLNNLRPITVSAWIKLGSAGGGGAARIVDKRQSGTAGWSFYVCGPPNSGCSDGHRLGFRQVFSMTDGNWETGASLAVDLWHHVAVTWDGSGIPRLYVDGASLPVTDTVGPPMGVPVDDTKETLAIGGTIDEMRTFDGSIDDVRIYRRMLSGQEIADLYAGNL